MRPGLLKSATPHGHIVSKKSAAPCRFDRNEAWLKTEFPVIGFVEDALRHLVSVGRDVRARRLE